jgi:hypothetical protein
MNSKDIVSLYEAYAAVYDEDLRDELESSSIQEDLSFVDDLSDNDISYLDIELLQVIINFKWTNYTYNYFLN